MDTVRCASCGEEIGAESTVCPHCGSDPRSITSGQFAAAGAAPTPPAPPAPPAPASTPPPAKASPPYVPRHTVRRGVASLIDWLILGIVAIVVWSVTINTSGSSDSDESSVKRFLLLAVVVAGILFVYGSVLESLRGATLGKLIVGVRTRLLDGRRCSAGSALLRNVSKAVVGTAAVLFAMGVGGLVIYLRSPGSQIYWSRLIALLVAWPVCLIITFSFMMTSPLRRRLGDRLAGTVVVRRRAAYPGPTPAETPMHVSPPAAR